jgi:hypothetical protein
MGIYTMIIKTENSELEISIGTDVYLGSRASGQIFKSGMILKIIKSLDWKSYLKKLRSSYLNLKKCY